jgi:molybdopterin converting factor subunit 1
MVSSGYFTARQVHHQPHHPQGFKPRNPYNRQTRRRFAAMTLTVHLFAAAKDLAQVSTLMASLDDGATVTELRLKVVKQVPALNELLPRCAIAVNHEFAGDEVTLNAGDEVAVIPPVSGGQFIET